MNDNRKPNRPTLAAQGGEAQEAIDAVARLVEELQTGWDQHDADISNRHFAADVMWGSPFGATVHGYEELHAIHVRLKRRGRGGISSCFEIVRVLVPAPGVALAQVRRVALDSDGEPIERPITSRGRSPRWRYTYWCATAAFGGSPPARTRPFGLRCRPRSV